MGINAQRDIAAARRLIERQVPVDAAALADPSQPLAAMLKRAGVSRRGNDIAGRCQRQVANGAERAAKCERSQVSLSEPPEGNRGEAAAASAKKGDDQWMPR